MISEVVNALFLTYVATEYLIANESSFDRAKQSRLLKSQACVVLAFVGGLNVVDRVTGAHAIINKMIGGFLHLPKILFVSWAYILALFIDCRRVSPIDFATYMKKVFKAFIYVLPVYPFLAVVISAGFLVVNTLFDALRIPEAWLNLPVYYGTMYGPFSVVYWRVKKSITEDFGSLPSFSGQGRTLSAWVLVQQFDLNSPNTFYHEFDSLIIIAWFVKWCDLVYWDRCHRYWWGS